MATLPMDEFSGNLTAYELRRQSMEMDVPNKERSLALKITEGSDLKDDEMTMITKTSRKLIDESEDVNNKKEQLSKECIILKAKCKNLKLRACETESENIVLKNQRQEPDDKEIGLVRNLKKAIVQPEAALEEGTETPPTKGRTTRSQRKQSEDDLERTLAESKKKVAAKEKKKVGESSETIEIEEMDLVLHDEDEAEEVEVMTPSAKKIKTSKKESHAKSIDTKSSALAKRTNFARKSRKMQIVEEESEEEEKTGEENDKMVKFGKRTILKERLLKDLEDKGIVLLLEKLEI
uniref:Uncharacterized protein n=1 Tax=Nicotiana tabacum TaxID=4097 RepID=A0A1S4DAT2_TOBAC|nr:PREDICTED: uncharacterized protein LOC107827779 [Nicotiana tabacum]